MNIIIIAVILLAGLFWLYRKWKGRGHKVEGIQGTPVVIVGDYRSKPKGCGVPIVFVTFLLLIAIGVIAWLVFSK